MFRLADNEAEAKFEKEVRLTCLTPKVPPGNDSVSPEGTCSSVISKRS